MNEQGFFKMALDWQKLIEQESISRAEISRREGLSRARVTQLMSLLKLPEKVQQGLLAGAPEYAGWTVRRAIRASKKTNS